MRAENCVKTDNEIRKKPAAAVHRVLKYEVLPLFKVLRPDNLLRFLATIIYLFAFDTKLLMITWGLMLQKY